MKIAIDCADLDSSRIDGTRVYIKNLLDYFGKLDQESQFLLYHKKDFNPLLVPKRYPNYTDRKIPYPFWWTQTRFAYELRRDCPDVCWMPIQQIPYIGPKGARYVVTIHDLAFKIFPDQFMPSDRRKLNLFTDGAIRKADRIIAISQATRKDILKYYPKVKKEKIFVVHHGVNAQEFTNRCSKGEIRRVLQKYNINTSHTAPKTKNQGKNESCPQKAANYILYVGAIQPRKNIATLVRAFEKLKKTKEGLGLKLVIVGEKAWMAESTLDCINDSSQSENIVLTGKVGFEELKAIYQASSLFVLPSLYEGFGIPVLEAFASGVPVVVADNSSLVEVGGDAVRTFEGRDHGELAAVLQKIINNPTIREKMVHRGLDRVGQFTWDKCARKTLKVLKAENGSNWQIAKNKK